MWRRLKVAVITGRKDSDLDKALKEKPEAEYVNTVRPDGVNTRVHKDDVTKALRKGYKRR